MTTNKTKVTAIVLAQLARESIETDAERIEALYLAINYIEFGTNLDFLSELEYPQPEV